MYRFLQKMTLSAAGAASLVTAVFLMAGCGQGPVDDTAGAVSFSPIESQTVAPQVVADPQMVPDEEREQIEAIVGGFEKNAAKFFERGDPEGRLAQIESVFIASGRYLDLVGIYQNVVEKQGISSRAVPRLVRAYLRLGQQHKARELLDEMIAKRGDQAQTWFLNGAYWLPEAKDSEEAAAKVVASWQRTLDLDPNFDGFEQPDAPPLRKQLAALRQRTPEKAVQKALAELGKQKSSEAAVAEQKPAVAEQKPAVAEQKQVAAKKPAATEEKPAVADTKPAKQPSQPAAKPAAKPSSKRTAEPVAVTVARGDMALAQGDADKADQFYAKALERDPESAAAKFGQIRAGWTHEDKRNDMARALRELAARDDLTPRQQYEIGRFAAAKLSDNKLAVELWKKARERDPSLAETVGLDALIDQAGR